VSRVRQAAEKLSRLFALRRLYRLVHDKDTPEARGRNLLRDWLTAEQRRQFDTFGYFDVIGSISGKQYRIHFGLSANVQELGNDGRPRMGWCFVPTGDLVPADVMLAQKIALETSEAEALLVAKRFPAAIPTMRGQIDRPFWSRM
jgi:hypothetical protein